MSSQNSKIVLQGKICLRKQDQIHNLFCFAKFAEANKLKSLKELIADLQRNVKKNFLNEALKN